MGRLIDATIQSMFLTDYILERKDTFIRVLEKADNDFLFGMLMDYFDAQQTAYDVDKVIDQLEHKANQYRKASERYAVKEDISESCRMAGIAASYDDAIEIVKEGGIC